MLSEITIRLIFNLRQTNGCSIVMLYVLAYCTKKEKKDSPFLFFSPRQPTHPRHSSKQEVGQQQPKRSLGNKCGEKGGGWEMHSNSQFPACVRALSGYLYSPTSASRRAESLLKCPLNLLSHLGEMLKHYAKTIPGNFSPTHNLLTQL